MLGQICLQSRSDPLPDGSGHPGEIRREQAVQEGCRGGGLRLRVLGTVDQSAPHPDHLGPQSVPHSAQIGDLRGQGDEIGQP
ncbi:hypothetical protein PZ61_0204445 [Streptomyces sp. MNU77]|nr:hypothetical protein PZ61_0204445 [Streptomyces sp. MNU77]